MVGVNSPPAAPAAADSATRACRLSMNCFIPRGSSLRSLAPTTRSVVSVSDTCSSLRSECLRGPTRPSRHQCM
jgi:hypothetical protein